MNMISAIWSFSQLHIAFFSAQRRKCRAAQGLERRQRKESQPKLPLNSVS